jgi:(p)ppGpp synthase/HD superfamily hydrolase
MNLTTAILIATKAHHGQLDKAGQPYILHPLRVMLRFKTEAERVVAALHDVIEDSRQAIESVTLDSLRWSGLPDHLVAALNALTRREGESYRDFIQRCAKDQIALRVKIADLEDNMDMSRIAVPSEEDQRRYQKYRVALETLRFVQFGFSLEALEQTGKW